MQVLECRNQKVNLHDPRGSVWCAACLHYTIPTNEGLCACCLVKLPKYQRASFVELKKFEKILSSCEGSIQEYMKKPCSLGMEFGWPVHIGIVTFFVPVRFLAEYAQMHHKATEDEFKQFLEEVRSQCAILPRYIHAVK